MALEVVAAKALEVATIEAAKKAAVEAAREVAEKVVSNALENTRTTQPEPHNDTVGQIQQMENQRVNEIGGQEASEKIALKQKEMEAAEALKGKIEGQQAEIPTAYEGGSYRDLAQNRIEGTEIHHIPPASVNGLEYNDGPAIRMDTADHRETASCGASNEAREYRAQQGQLIKEGRFEEAMNNDIAEVKEKFYGKYDDAIGQAKEYYELIHSEGKC